MGMWHTSCKRQAASQLRGNNSCLQTHQLPKIAIRGVIGVVDGQQRERERGRGERTWHPQSACCVASNFINTFIILCHTASGTSGACTPLPCPTPHSHPPLPVQTAISLPQRALWLVIWRLISGLTWQRLLPVLMLFNIVLQLLCLSPSPPCLLQSELIKIIAYICYSVWASAAAAASATALLLSSSYFSACHWVLLSFYSYPPVSLLSPLYSIYNVDASDMHT